MSLHWEAITPRMRQVLRTVGESDLSSRFYLAGGTALALQLGHRRSVDLDLFSATDQVRPDTHAELMAVLQPLGPVIVEQTWGNLVLLTGELRVGFFGYGYPLLEEGVGAEGTRLASLLDLGLMKLDAVATRAMRKDFCDLYALSPILSLRQLLDAAPRKYPGHRDFEARVVRYLTFFDQADLDEPVELIPDADWDDVKRFFRRQAEALSTAWWRDTDQG